MKIEARANRNKCKEKIEIMKARLPEGVQMKRGDMMKQIQAMQQQMEETQA